MNIKRFFKKGEVIRFLRPYNSFNDSISKIEAEIKAVEQKHGIFNAVAVLDKSEGSDLHFTREQVSICEIDTKYDSFTVLTFSMVGYDLLDSKKLVIFNITHLQALKWFVKQGEVVFRSNDLYKSLNKEETKVLRRQRALRHGNFSNEAETASEVEYAAENGYLSEFVEDNGSEVWNWYKNTSADFNDSEESLYGFDSEIEDILESLRAEDNSLSSVTPIEAYLPSDSRWDRGKTSKSKYTCRGGVSRETPTNMLSDKQTRHNRLVRENFRRFKHSMESMNKLLARRVELGQYEDFLRLIKGSRESLEQFEARMALDCQKQQAEAESEEFALWLLSVADLLTSAHVRMEMWADLALNGQIEGHMSFVTAKELAEQAEQAERD